MLLLIIGLHFILGSIWLINHNSTFLAIICFVAGMAATHYGWKNLSTRKGEKQEPPENDA